MTFSNNKKNVYAVILAGGVGTRFWPKSRRKEPKQFLNINHSKSLLQQTLLRIKSKIRSSSIYIVTNTQYQKHVFQQIKSFKIPASNILLEPEGKNTAPAICWAAAHIYKKDKNAYMVILPADHIILNERKFLSVLEKAIVLADKKYLVTLGIVPTRPDTGYGYLKIKSILQNGQKILKVQKFTEKPNMRKAEKFLETKCYLWNSGMFVWRCDVILDAFQKYLVEVYEIFQNQKTVASIKRSWHKLPNISVDYGILEKAKNVATIPARNIGWSDLGSWESVAEILNKDSLGNVMSGDVLHVNCKKSFILGHKRVVAAVGLENIVVVDSDDAVLICRKDCSQDVKTIVSMLEKQKRQKLL